MPIYARSGDDGTTALFGGRRVSKSDPQVITHGSVDELSSFIGLLIEKVSLSDKIFLTEIQNDLYIIMSLLSGAPVKPGAGLYLVKNTSLELKVKKIEKKIDEIETKLPKLTRFILPQGNTVSVLFHIARAVCRRAERESVDFFNISKTIEQLNNRTIIKYLNRLSDFFFVLARFYSKKEVFAHM